MSEHRTCQNCKSQFTIEPADFDFYRKIDVPPPTWCPECRYMRRLSFFNERVLYKRKCDLCSKNIIAMYPADSDLTVYCNSCWWSDAWDPLSFGRKYDPTRTFFAQFRELVRAVPRVCLEVNYPTLINSDYINHSATSKNCYLIFTADYCENVLYSSILANDKDSMDCIMLGESELCYGNINIGKCYTTHFSEDSNSCRDCYFVKDCTGCDNCFGCMGLRNKRYHIFNQRYEKKEYEKKIKEFHLNTHHGLQEARKATLSFWLTRPHKFIHDRMNKNITGDYVYNSKNARDMFMVRGAEDCRFCQILTLPSTKDTYDLSIWGNGVQRVYEALIVGEGADQVKFSMRCWPECRGVEYCDLVMSSSDMFGCVGVRKKQYCILNQQYVKEDYEMLCGQIRKDMDANPYVDAGGRAYRYGEFFPQDISLHTYNESYAIDFFPLTREEAEQRGLSWKELPGPSASPTLRGNTIPGDILDTPDTILDDVLECGTCLRPFRLVPAELSLLRRFGFPVPDHCFYCRYKQRLERINPPRLHARQCAKCGQDIQTPYSPERPEIIYCERCYNSEVA
ncbi:MAG: hypothetical protein HY978_02685 [Candidatus Liptonbacteria bacterium]|nr:hypothetical protein [Candidatus Liptonbacteria bacterium]